jgi:hypothetical protein
MRQIGFAALETARNKDMSAASLHWNCLIVTILCWKTNISLQPEAKRLLLADWAPRGCNW